MIFDPFWNLKFVEVSTFKTHKPSKILTDIPTSTNTKLATGRPLEGVGQYYSQTIMTVYAMDFMFPGVLIHSGFCCSLFKVEEEFEGAAAVAVGWSMFLFFGKTSRLLALIGTLTHRHTYMRECVYVCAGVSNTNNKEQTRTHVPDCSPRTWTRKTHLVLWALSGLLMSRAS